MVVYESLGMWFRTLLLLGSHLVMDFLLPLWFVKEGACLKPLAEFRQSNQVIGGNPQCLCPAALASIEVIEEEQIPRNVREVGCPFHAKDEKNERKPSIIEM